jgi:uncharacterized protein (DUF58 family)
MESRLKLRQRTVPFIIAVLLGLQFKDPSRVYTILLVAFGGMFLIAWVWAYWLGREIKLLRETRLNWVQVGNHIEERLTLSNTSMFPAPHVELKDYSTLPNFNAGRVTSISAGSIDQWTVSAFCQRRGMFTLGDAEITTGDPFGIVDVTIYAPMQASILVLPQVVPLPELNVTSSGMLGEGQPRRNSPQQTMHASTVREFAEGDSLKLVHWPTTARMNKTYVRLMESAPEGHWWVILDLDQRYMRGAEWDSIEEQSVSLAASLADLGLRARKSVGLVCNGSVLKWLPPQKGEAQQWEILQSLAMAAPGTLSLANLFDKMQASFGSHHSLLIVTACTQLDWIKSFPSLIKRGLLPTVLLMDPSSFEGGDSMEAVVSVLSMQKVQYHIMPRGLIEPPKLEPHSFNQWTRHAAPTAGHAVQIRNS